MDPAEDVKQPRRGTRIAAWYLALFQLLLGPVFCRKDSKTDMFRKLVCGNIRTVAQLY